MLRLFAICVTFCVCSAAAATAFGQATKPSKSDKPLNIPGATGPAQPLPTGNQMEDAFEQIALLMNNAFRLANAPAWPNVSVTPLAIYRTAE